MKAINEHFEVGQQYYALVSKEVLVVSEVLQPGMYPSGSGGYYTLRSSMVRFKSEKTGLVHTCSLALAKHLLGGHGACRVHGGGFAGTIQAYVPETLLQRYHTAMERVFGPGSCYVLRLREQGARQVL